MDVSNLVRFREGEVRVERRDVVLFYPGNYKEDKYHWFPFSYLYIAPFLEKAGYNPRIIDARIEPDWEKLLNLSLKNALCLGITALTGRDIKSAMKAANIARKMDPKLPIIWGGPHATAVPHETVKADCVDIVVSGQGEKTMLELVESIYYKRDYAGIPGTTCKKDGKIHQNKMQEILLFDYDSNPAFHLIDIEKYRSPNNVISIFTVRGCPFRCTFCTTKDKDFSERSLEQVKSEILHVVKDLDFKNIFFQDGTYFVKKNRVMDIANFIIESNLNIKWKAKARVNSLTKYSDEDISILKKSGLVSLFFGIESGSERILKNMHKDTKRSDAEKSAEICSRFNIELYTSFMFATPGETVEDLILSISLIKKLRKINPNIIVQSCVYRPLPDTSMFAHACRLGYVPPASLEEWARKGISSKFDDWGDITWIPKDILNEYMNVYNKEFNDPKPLFEKEKDGSYVSVFKEGKDT